MWQSLEEFWIVGSCVFIQTWLHQNSFPQIFVDEIILTKNFCHRLLFLYQLTIFLTKKLFVDIVRQVTVENIKTKTLSYAL